VTLPNQSRKTARTVRRDLFAELNEGMTALADARKGKRTLRTSVVEYKPVPDITPRQLVQTREELNISRALFAAYLRINVRTLENWEQGRAKPNAQAALLIRLVRRYPDTVQRLAAI
jgi:putative transcriptional regulator